MRKDKEEKIMRKKCDAQWRNHTRAITGSARAKFIFAQVAPILKMIRVSCA